MNGSRIVTAVFLISLATIAWSQDPKIDSLKNLISKSKTDSVTVNGLIELSRIYLSIDLSKAIAHANQARTIAEKAGYQKGLGYAYKAVAIVYYNQSNYPEALVQFQNSLNIFENLNFKTGIANILSNIGAVYYNTGDDTQAIEYHLKSLKVSEEINDKMRIGTSMNNIGSVYKNNLATVDKGLGYFLKALPIFEEINYDDGVGTISGNIGEIYFDWKQYEKALPYFVTALKVYAGTIDATFPLTMLGKIYALREDFQTAYFYHNQAIEIAAKLDAKLELTQSLLGLAETQRKEGKTKDAIATYKRAENIGNSVKARKEIKEVYESLSKSYSTLGDFRNAYVYETLYAAIKDTLLNNDEVNKIQQLQFNFDINKKEAAIDLLTKDQALKAETIKRQKLVNYAAAVTGFLLLLVIGGFYNRYKYVRKTNKIIQKERDKSKELLLNILPEETARELENSGFAKTRYYESVTVLFTDFKGFSTIAGKLTPQALVAELNDYFGTFDEIVGRFGLEKIKTIGDAYMCAGGIPLENDTHPFNAVMAALAMQEYMIKQNSAREARGEQGWELRIGIHTGPIVAGVVGKKKYAYDIWGDTVNVASRMESNGEAGKVNISSATYDKIKEHYQCLHRGKISAKNIGEVDMYFVESKITKPAALELA
jgi:class 3 adenylate cyclase